MKLLKKASDAIVETENYNNTNLRSTNKSQGYSLKEYILKSKSQFNFLRIICELIVVLRTVLTLAQTTCE